MRHMKNINMTTKTNTFDILDDAPQMCCMRSIEKPFIVQFNNGYADLNTGKFTIGELSSSTLTNMNINCNYPIVTDIDDQDITNYWRHDANLVPYDQCDVQEQMVGSFLNGLYKYKNVNLWAGGPKTGKTTFMKLIQETFGNEYCKSITLDENRHTQDMMDIGKYTTHQCWNDILDIVSDCNNKKILFIDNVCCEDAPAIISTIKSFVTGKDNYKKLNIVIITNTFSIPTVLMNGMANILTFHSTYDGSAEIDFEKLKPGFVRVALRGYMNYKKD